MAEKKLNYYSVGQLRELLKDIQDNAPIVAIPLNDNVRVALNVNIVRNGKLGDSYEGDIVAFETGLFDIPSGKEIKLNPSQDVIENEQGNN